MDDEMTRMIQIAIKGITITDETLDMDVIHEVGPSGSYITHDHTLSAMRSQSHARLFDRRSRDTWMENTGGQPIRERAYKAAVDILNNHKPMPLPEGAPETMQEIVEEFENELKKNKK
jgi:trimethylamine--corrinoid protein Co-methyltransferase